MKTIELVEGLPVPCGPFSNGVMAGRKLAEQDFMETPHLSHSCEYETSTALVFEFHGGEQVSRLGVQENRVIGDPDCLVGADQPGPDFLVAALVLRSVFGWDFHAECVADHGPGVVKN